MLWEWGRLGRLKPPAIAVAGGSMFVLLELICGASMLLRGAYALGSGCGVGMGRLWEVWFVLGVGWFRGVGMCWVREVVEWYIKPLEPERKNKT